MMGDRATWTGICSRAGIGPRRGALAPLLAILLLGGCASGVDGPQIRADRLLDHREVFGSEAAELPLPQAPIVAASAEMREYLERFSAQTSNPYHVIDRLVSDLFDSDGRNMAYDQNSTLTAAEAFAQARGNCLSYSNLLVSFARELGLHAEYREVEIPPTWDESQADIYLYDQHVNVMIGHGGVRRVFDVNAPGGMEAMMELKSWPIDDRTAFAQYYSNVGVNHLVAGELPDAFRYFKKSHLTDPEYLPVWVNLGILLRRAGRSDLAEAAYLRVLRERPNDYLALSNLAHLYQFMGDETRAAAIEKRVEKARLRNPYLRYRMALEAIDEGDYAAAKRHLLAAIRQLGDEPRLYLFLGAVNLQLDEHTTAESNFRRAEKMASTEDERARLGNKAKVLRELVESGYQND